MLCRNEIQLSPKKEKKIPTDPVFKLIMNFIGDIQIAYDRKKVIKNV